MALSSVDNVVVWPSLINEGGPPARSELTQSGVGTLRCTSRGTTHIVQFPQAICA